MSRILVARLLVIGPAVAAFGCGAVIIEGSSTSVVVDETETSGDGDTGDGDGDTGDGDGDTGDGDGDGDTGDGDGDSGDGDGDTGDGDGDTGDGDGDGDADTGPLVAVGGSHTCARKGADLWCWGSGTFGQLGHGNTTMIGDNELPVEIGPVPVGAGVVTMAAGDTHTCAVTDLATLRCWGNGGGGRLGYSNVLNLGDDETPAVVLDVPLGTQALSVDAGRSHTCALTTTGGVRCFGTGLYLGYGDGGQNVGDNETPASAGDVELGGPATALACGGSHTCAILQGGALRCWGQGGLGTLGYGNFDAVGISDTPADAGDVDVGGLVAQVALGDQHSCARLVDGSVRCWGQGALGRLGYGNTETIGDNEVPASVGPVELGGPAIDIAAGYFHTCAVLEDGAVRCWGSSLYGALGQGELSNIGDNETPASVAPVDIGGPAVDVATGNAVTCAARASGEIYCWGWGGYGGLGYGETENVGDDEVPAAAGPVLL